MTGRTDAASVVWRWTSGTPHASTRARAALRCALEQFGLDPGAIADAVLAVSELVANAVEHAVGPYEMRVRRSGRQIICEVEDHDPRIPVISDLPAGPPFVPVEEHRGGGADALCGLLAERGRGLHIVHELSGGAWGFRRSSRSTKAAWLVVPGSFMQG
ncbi:ATP-binding protein [Streptomyces sp. NPDC057877]|uniref:ATP-binding protein n=1 Tax=Streptomyces sp. NPDC057877 TaxID=3346269 RepID=UPI0036A3508E